MKKKSSMQKKSNKRKIKQYNRKNSDLNKILKRLNFVWNDLSDQLNCTQKAIAHIRIKTDTDAKTVLNYILYGQGD